jgi:DNA polymerase III sliding clamp (beta) subunit (PCNA family)
MNAMNPMIAAATVALSATMDRKSFTDAAKVAKRVTEKRNTIPILSHALVTISRDMATLTATDLDMTSITEIPAANEGEGAFTVDCHGLAAALAKFKGESVILTRVSPSKAELSCPTSGARVTLASFPAEDFPELGMGDVVASFWMPELQLRDSLDAVAHAMSTEETRYYLQGAFLHTRSVNPPERTAEHEAAVDRLAELRRDLDSVVTAAKDKVATGTPEADAGFEARIAIDEAIAEARLACDEFEAARMAPDTLTFAATDGHRLAIVDRPLPEGAAALPDSIFPRKAVKVALAIIGKKGTGHADVRIESTATKMRLCIGRHAILTKLIDGTFPDYRRVIPYDVHNIATVDADALASAIGTVTAACNERSRAVALSVVEGQPLVLSATSPEQGRSAATVDAVIASDDASRPSDMAIGFNAAYLAAAMGEFAGHDARLAFSDSAGPALFKCDARPELTLVLMPMRVDASVLSVADAKALNMTAWERFAAGPAGDAKATAKETGLVRRDAVADLVSRGTVKAVARNIVQAFVAIATGDAAAHSRAKLVSHGLQGGTLRSVAAIDAKAAEDAKARDPMEIVRRSHANAEAAELDAAVEAETALDEAVEKDLEPDPAPDEGDEDAAVRGAAMLSGAALVEAVAETVELAAPVESTPVPEPEPVAALAAETDDVPATLDPPAETVTDALGTESIVKIADVYGRVFFVLAEDYASDKPMLRRVHKGGAPFTDSEAKGGAWQRICRDNVARRILPRGSVDRPAKASDPATPAADGLAERVAALETALAALQGGQPSVAAPVEPVAKPERSAAHLRAIRAYLASRAIRGVLQESEAKRQWAEQCVQTVTGERDAALADASAARTFRRDLLGQRIRRVKTALHYRGKASGLADTVARLQVRCDALERLTVDSAGLDARPAEPVKPSIILPVVTAGARR